MSVTILERKPGSAITTGDALAEMSYSVAVLQHRFAGNSQPPHEDAASVKKSRWNP